MNKDLIYKNFDTKDVEHLIEICTNANLYFEMYDGNLLDNYIIYNTENIIFDNEKVDRKYIIIEEIYISEWNSDYKILLTDNIKKVEDFKKEMEKVYEVVNSYK